MRTELIYGARSTVLALVVAALLVAVSARARSVEMPAATSHDLPAVAADSTAALDLGPSNLRAAARASLSTNDGGQADMDARTAARDGPLAGALVPPPRPACRGLLTLAAAVALETACVKTRAACPSAPAPETTAALRPVHDFPAAPTNCQPKTFKLW